MATYGERAPTEFGGETLPSFYRYSPNPVAAPAEMRRLWIAPRSGSEFVGGSKLEFTISCGQPGMHLDPSQSALVFSIKNNSTQTLTLDGGAHALIEQIDVSFGSQVISTTRGVNNLMQLLSDFQSDPDSLRNSGAIRGVAPFDVTAVAPTQATINAAYRSRAGLAITTGQSITFALPLLCALGTLSMKAIPLSALMDTITLEIRLAPVTQWGVFAASPNAAEYVVNDARFFHSLIKLDGRVESALYASLGNVISLPTLDYRNYSMSIAASTGGISWTIPHKSASATAIFITLRETAKVDNFAQKTFTERTKGTMVSYRFMVDSEVVPQSAVICAANAVEARLELNRAFGVISDASARSSIDGASFGTDGFCIGLNLSAFPSSSALSDGVSTRNRHLVFEATLASNNPALRLDAYVCSETLLVAQEGLLSIDI